MRVFCLALSLCVLNPLTPTGWSEQRRPVPGHMRSLPVPRTEETMIVNGMLDEPAWKNASVADGFWMTEKDQWPAEKTEVLVIADDGHLYFGFRAYDSQPDKILAYQTRRDGGLGLDDQVGVELDPFHNHREISTYSINSIGTQDDAIAGGRARNIQWKGDWTAAAVRTDYGWSAEIAIPFEILNYRDGNTTFGINLVRYHNRTDEWSRWADLTPQNKPEEMGLGPVFAIPKVLKMAGLKLSDIDVIELATIDALQDNVGGRVGGKADEPGAASIDVGR